MAMDSKKGTIDFTHVSHFSIYSIFSTQFQPIPISSGCLLRPQAVSVRGYDRIPVVDVRWKWRRVLMDVMGISGYHGFIHIHMHVYIYMYVCIYICDAYVFYICVCMCIYMCIYIYIIIYIYTNKTNTWHGFVREGIGTVYPIGCGSKWKT